MLRAAGARRAGPDAGLSFDRRPTTDDRRGTSGPDGRGHQREASRTRSRDNHGKGGGERDGEGRGRRLWPAQSPRASAAWRPGRIASCAGDHDDRRLHDT